MAMRILTALVGDVKRKADMQTKYSAFFDALADHFEIVEHYDASLSGAARYQSALQSFDPSIKKWKERFFRNEYAFVARSKKLTRHIQKLTIPVDAILQLGAMFDGTWGGPPVFLYTDNTTAITARHPEAGRYAFTPEELTGWLNRERVLYERAVHIFVRSNIVKNSLGADYSIPPDKISVVGGGVNFSTLPKIPTRSVRDDPTILFVGQNFYRKGGDLLLKAFALAHTKMNNIKLLIVTDDLIPDSLPRAGVSRIDIGWNRVELAKLYQQADIFALPARQETWGDVLLEAMAFGLPCLGVTGQAMEDIIQHERTGFLVNPGDIESLASYIVMLSADVTLRRNMGLQAYDYVANHFTWNHVAAQMFSVIDAKVQPKK